MKDIKLQSGATLRITLAPFTESRQLFQAVLKEMGHLKLDDMADVDANFFKDIFCALLSSKEVEKEIWICMGRALYNDEKITEETFEDEKAREDYIAVCYEIAWVNIGPFMKGLYAKLTPLIDQAKSFLP